MEPFICRPSYAQDRLWLVDRMAPGDPSYNLAWAFRMTGPLDVTALEDAFSALVGRHEVLRTTFREVDGRPMQVVASTWDSVLHFEDLTANGPLPPDVLLRRRLREVAGEIHDLERGPLFQPRLFRLAEEEHVLLIRLHHIVSDGASVAVLQRDLAMAYAGDTLPELPVQYADFAEWQRTPSQYENQHEQLGHWREQLAGAPAPLRLPADRARGTATAPSAGRHEFLLPEEDAARLQELAREESATVFMILLAASAIVLGRYTRQDDLVIGVPYTRRDQPELEDFIGLFVETLPLRLKPAAGLTCRQLLGHVRDACLGGFENADVPLERLVQELRPNRDIDGHPFFRTMCVMHAAEQPVLSLPGLEIRREPLDPLPAPYEMVLSFVPAGATIRGRIDYAAELFDEARMTRMAGHLRTLLSAASKRPDDLVSRLPILTEAEHDQLVYERNRVEPSDADVCLHDLVAERASSTPDAEAVTCGSQRLTYEQLTERAGLVARHLRRLGVGPDTVVGVCLEPSTDLVAALLGVLTAGGAYLPLDPAHPAERLALLMEDAGADVVLTQEDLRGLLSASGHNTLCLDADWPEISAASPAPYDGAAPRPDHLAYVIYTSGSTGRPNGVMVTHANVARLLSSTAAWFGFGPEDVWTLCHSFAFDFSVWELWGALAHGGRVVVLPRDVVRDPDALLELLGRERVTVLNQTPAAFLQLAEADEAAGSPPLALRQVILGGEALDPRALRGWMERRGHLRPRLSNMYGITETTVHVTHHRLDPSDLDAGSGSPIGVRIPDLRTYVLDETMTPVPEGIPGELHIGGPGVARGYLRRPALTSKRFVPDPYAICPGARLYRTGDLVRWRAGRLEFLGRVDDQATIRGHRVELGEVEAALTAHPAVSASVVVSREDASGAHGLAAYTVPTEAESTPPHPAELRAFLARRLPEYMIPGFFVALERLPLTVNGKVDRTALPAPDNGRAAPSSQSDRPGTRVEAALVSIWADVLGLDPDKVGVHDDFLDLGGHSLLAVRMINRIRDELGFTLTVRTLFEQATVARIGRLIEGQT